MVDESKLPVIHLVARCRTCKRKHEYRETTSRWLTAMDEWRNKHLGHDIEFVSPRREIPRGFDDSQLVERNITPWFDGDPFKPNADIKLAYASSAAYTIGLQTTPLASSASLVLGRQSTAISNTANLYLDYGIAAKITVGSTITANTVIEVWMYSSFNDTPLYPDTITGTDGDVTMTADAIKRDALHLLGALNVDTTTANRGYYMRLRSILELLGHYVPKNHGLFVTHNTGSALHATGSNHILSYTGAYATG